MFVLPPIPNAAGVHALFETAALLIGTQAYWLAHGLRLRWGLRAEDIPLPEIEWIRPASDLGFHLPKPFLSMPGALLGAPWGVLVLIATLFATCCRRSMAARTGPISEPFIASRPAWMALSASARTLPGSWSPPSFTSFSTW